MPRDSTYPVYIPLVMICFSTPRPSSPPSTSTSHRYPNMSSSSNSDDTIKPTPPLRSAKRPSPYSRPDSPTIPPLNPTPRRPAFHQPTHSSRPQSQLLQSQPATTKSSIREPSTTVTTSSPLSHFSNDTESLTNPQRHPLIPGFTRGPVPPFHRFVRHHALDIVTQLLCLLCSVLLYVYCPPLMPRYFPLYEGVERSEWGIRHSQPVRKEYVNALVGGLVSYFGPLVVMGCLVGWGSRGFADGNAAVRSPFHPPMYFFLHPFNMATLTHHTSDHGSRLRPEHIHPLYEYPPNLHRRSAPTLPHAL